MSAEEFAMMQKREIDQFAAIWTRALRLPGQYDFVGSTLHEIGPWRGVNDLAIVRRRCENALCSLKLRWERTVQGLDARQVENYYNAANDCIEELMWWHTLADDNSPLAYVAASEFASSAGLKTYLDFGSGVAQRGDGFEPAEDFFHAFALALTYRIAGMTSSAIIDHTGWLARDMRTGLVVAQLSYKLFTIVALVRSQRDPTAAWNVSTIANADCTYRMIVRHAPLRRYVAEHSALLVVRPAHAYTLLQPRSPTALQGKGTYCAIVLAQPAGSFTALGDIRRAGRWFFRVG